MKRSILFFLFSSWLVFASQPLIASKDSTHFVTTWRTYYPGASNAKSITIATDERYEYNFDIDWNNDGIFDDLGVTKSISHEYEKKGDYTIRIRGLYPRIAFEKPPLIPLGDQLKLLSVDQWGTNVWQDLNSAFYFCQNLKVFADDIPDLTVANDLSYLFANATFFTGDLENWDVSTVTNMEGMFLNNQIFNSDLFEWDVSSVTSMRSMFQGAATFDQDLYYWDVGRVTDLSFMFKDAILFNGDVSDWNVYNAEKVRGMFDGCISFDRKFTSSWLFSPNLNSRGLYNSQFNLYGYGLASVIIEAFIYGLIVSQ